MAIARVTRPSVVLAGTVDRTMERRRKSDQSLFAHAVLLRQDSGASVEFSIFLRDGQSVSVPPVGQYIVVECEVEESAEYGAALGFVRPGDDALDRMLTGLKNSGAK